MQCTSSPPVSLCIILVLQGLTLVFTIFETIRVKPKAISFYEFSRWNTPVRLQFNALICSISYQVFTAAQTALMTCGTYQTSSLAQALLSTPAMILYTSFETITLFASLYRFERIQTIARGTRRYYLLVFVKVAAIAFAIASVILHILQLFYQEGIIPTLYVSFTAIFSAWILAGDAYTSTKMTITVLRTASLGENINRNIRRKATSGIRNRLTLLLVIIASLDLLGVCLFLVDENMKLFGVVIAVAHSITSFRLLAKLKQGLETAKRYLQKKTDENASRQIRNVSDQIQDFKSTNQQESVDSDSKIDA